MAEVRGGYTRGAAAEIGPQIQALLEKGETVTLQVSGDSMRPTLKPRRDAVLLEELPKWPPERGDILFFKTARSDAGYSLHRVLRADANEAVMNGDAQGWTETIVPGSVVGRVSVILRAGVPVPVDTKSYRVYVRCWRITRPFRKPLFAIWRGLKGLVGGKNGG